MTYLQQELEARRALQREPEDYVTSTGGAASAVTLQQASGETWVFLWSTLVSAWLDQVEGREVIVLTFLRHVVRLEGQNLDRIMNAIGEMRLHTVREHDSSEDFKGHSQTGRTVVIKIAVKLVEGSPAESLSMSNFTS